MFARRATVASACLGSAQVLRRDPADRRFLLLVTLAFALFCTLMAPRLGVAAIALGRARRAALWRRAGSRRGGSLKLWGVARFRSRRRRLAKCLVHAASVGVAATVNPCLRHVTCTGPNCEVVRLSIPQISPNSLGADDLARHHHDGSSSTRSGGRPARPGELVGLVDFAGRIG